jgi:hypothetical protein
MRPCQILWRGARHSWLSPMNSDLGSTQILAWHFDAKSQTVSQLTNSGLRQLGKYLLFSPLRVIETLIDGVDAQAAPPSDSPNGTMGLH